ncbi:iron-sulfur cluster loop [Granulicella sp. WH15]|uniref:endonuclease III domain-containing protein n=1 Tax=Granulicella sp. WH15 TaxID=2602070 RepID=UPI0013674DA9|nr:iron-sulfur cluster loop [Granulicella sp. WH15]QHN05181.1 iron-sulfur cluster loop [Granulicella sp. WH15]
MQSASLFPSPADHRLPEIHQLLLEYYGKPKPREPWDPLKQFIYSLLSSRTKTEVSHQVVRDLEARYASWDDLRDAPVPEIEQAIAAVTFPETKAPWLKIALQQITARYGSLTLDFLARYRTDKIREWLEQFEGVGPKTSAAVVNFSTLRRRALCVDSHHLRVTQRLKLTPRADAAITEERLMRLVPEEWDAAMLDEHHSLIKLHGQKLCTFAEPQCKGCPLLQVCPTGKAKVE